MSDSQLAPFLKTDPPPVAPPSQARLQALYASTSTQRTANPTGYSANSQWWSSVLEETLRNGWANGETGDRLILKVDDALLGRLEDGRGLRPKGIGGVVQTLATTAPPTLHPLPHFLSSLTPLHLPPSLTSRLVGRPLWWAFSQLKPFGGDKVEKEETLWNRYGKGKEYVHMPLLEQSAAAFTAHMLKNPVLSYTSSLYDLESFFAEYAKACFPMGPAAKRLPKGTHSLSKRDVEVLVKWLSRDCGLLVTDGIVVKVLDTDQVAGDHSISDADRGAVSVANALQKIELQIIGIEEGITESHQKAKKHLSSNQKQVALSYLRSKKQLEDLLVKRVASSEQLRAVIRSIDQAKGDVETMAAYETSTATLSQVLAHPSLSPDRIAATTDALAEAMADQEEIDQAVRVGGEIAMGGRRVDIDESDLAMELEGLVEEEKAEEEKREEAKKILELAKAKSAEERGKREKPSSKEESTAVEVQKNQEAPSRLPVAPTTVLTRATGVTEEESISEEEKVWRQRYEEAQARKQAEKDRFDAERLRKEAGRVAAE